MDRVAMEILVYLRDVKGKATIRDVISNVRDLALSNNPFTWIFPIKTLVQSQLVELRDDEGKAIRGSGFDRLRKSLTGSDGYTIDVRPFRSLFVTLTPLLEHIQAITGLNLKRTLKESDSPVMRVEPLFGAPDQIPVTDVFVLAPFQPDFRAVYDDHIAKTCTALSLTCKRADDLFGSNAIMRDVWSLIAGSKVIVADCSGRNPNVFYELGIAHTLGRRVVLITRSAEDVPFDIRHIRFIEYEFTPRGMQEFEATLAEFIKAEMALAQ